MKRVWHAMLPLRVILLKKRNNMNNYIIKGNKVRMMKKVMLCAACFMLHASLFTLTSCSDDVDNVFGESAANRVAQDQSEYYKILEAATNGWAMDFYPADRIEGGVVYTARFKDGEVTMACEQAINNTVISKKYAAGTEVTSAYQIVSETGVMLTFNTYNPLFHYWSQPFKGHMNGYKSDYEFTFISACADSVVLRGKKYGNMLRMYPLKEAATSYVKKVAAMHNTLKSIPRKRAVVDGKTLPITLTYDLLTYQDGDAFRSVAIIHTPEGIRLYEPITLGGATLRSMTYDSDSQELRSDDRRVVLPKPKAIEEQFVATQTQWAFGYKYSVSKESYTLNDMCDELAGIIGSCADVVNNGTWGETVREVYLGANMEPFANDQHRWVLGWNTRISGSINYYIGYAVNMELIDMDKQLVSIQMLEGANLFSNYGYWQPFVDFVGNNSPYLVAFDNDTAPTEATLTSQKDATKWFKLKKK